MSDADIVQLFESIKASLERDMASLNTRMAGMDSKLDSILAAQRRYSKLSTADALVTRGMETSFAEHEARLLDLEERLRKLEPRQD